MLIIFTHVANNAVPLLNFGGGQGPIHMDEVSCNGNENSLFNCPRLTIHDCDHTEDAGVRCEGMCITRDYCQNILCNT